MGQVRHGSATTTHAIRAAIQRSQASAAELILDVDDVEARALGPLLSKPYRKQDLVRRIRDALADACAG